MSSTVQVNFKALSEKKKLIRKTELFLELLKKQDDKIQKRQKKKLIFIQEQFLHWLLRFKKIKISLLYLNLAATKVLQVPNKKLKILLEKLQRQDKTLLIRRLKPLVQQG